jgi:hypothetical protein
MRLSTIADFNSSIEEPNNLRMIILEHARRTMGEAKNALPIPSFVGSGSYRAPLPLVCSCFCLLAFSVIAQGYSSRSERAGETTRYVFSTLFLLREKRVHRWYQHDAGSIEIMRGGEK